MTLKIAFFTSSSPTMWHLQATSPSEPSGPATCAAEGECMQCSSVWRGEVPLRSPWHAPAAAPAPMLLRDLVRLLLLRCSSVTWFNSLIQQKTNPAGKR